MALEQFRNLIAGALLGGFLLPAGMGRAHGQEPEGWLNRSTEPAAYEVVLDGTVKHGGKSSCRIQSKDSPPENASAFLTQAFRAKEYRGKRVRLSGYIRAEGFDGEARMGMLVFNEEALLARDHMRDDRAVTGATDWRKVEIVLHAPEGSEAIQIYLEVRGKGKVWFDDLKLEPVGKDAKLTSEFEPEKYLTKRSVASVAAKPSNLDFETAAKDK
jgi:hypothetical protein